MSISARSMFIASIIICAVVVLFAVSENYSRVRQNNLLREYVLRNDLHAVLSADNQKSFREIKYDSGDSLLHLAKSGDMIRLLLAEHLDINASNDYGNTALHIASLSAKVDVVEALVKGGANVNALNSDGENALHMVCREIPTTKWDEQGFVGDDAFAGSASSDRMAIAKILLDAGVNRFGISKYNDTPSQLALKELGNSQLAVFVK